MVCRVATRGLVGGFRDAGAVAVGLEDVPDLAFAAVWGLIRSAQSEYPGALHIDRSRQREAILPALAGALASEEPQLAVRVRGRPPARACNGCCRRGSG